jgi:hypothetical protein
MLSLAVPGRDHVIAGALAYYALRHREVGGVRVMPRPGILLLLSGGVALAAYGQLPPTSDFSRDLAEITRISAAPDRSQQSDEIIRSFAPANLRTQSGAAAASGAYESAARAVTPMKSGTWSTVVMSESSAPTPVKSYRAADGATRYQLAHDLQRELQRVGCYQGEINGAWTNATRRAMAAFMDRANSVLPYDQPDYILLALVQSHQDVVCAAECPAGQVSEGGDRCVPRAVVAQASRKTKRIEDRRLAEQRLASATPPQTASEHEILPWLKRETPPAEAAQVAIAPRPNPLPGRMSIGGPQFEQPVPPALPASAPLLPVVAMPEANAQVSNTGDGSPDATNKVATLQYDPDADDLSDSNAVTGGAAPVATDAIVDAPKSKKSRRSDRESRPRRESYAYSGRRRHGDPRPGTARYNLMQSLGGIY